MLQDTAVDSVTSVFGYCKQTGAAHSLTREQLGIPSALISPLSHVTLLLNGGIQGTREKWGGERI